MIFGRNRPTIPMPIVGAPAAPEGAPAAELDPNTGQFLALGTDPNSINPLRLQHQLEALTVELDEQTRLYEETLEHVAVLENQQAEMRSHSLALEQANVRSALLMEELEDREQKYREQAESLRRTTEELDRVHRQLAGAHEELQKEQKLKQKYLTRVESELETARRVQHLLLREPPASAAGLELAVSYVPAGETGGDWIGFLHNEGRGEVELLIGDVTGHGLGAALITAGASAAVSALDELRRAASAAQSTLQPPGKGLRDLLRRAGAESVADCVDKLAEPRYLLELLDGVVGNMGGFRYLMTFFAASFQKRSRTLRYANAGHCLPLLLGKEDLAKQTRYGARSLQARGNPLGYDRDPGADLREQVMIKVEPGDLMLFMTDGLIENCDLGGHAIGTRKVVSWMRELYDRPVQEIRDGIERRVRDFLEDEPLADDMSFIVARVTE
jgi:sigma-B regulation protein RsbU (phosphoserine phosphatase)